MSSLSSYTGSQSSSIDHGGISSPSYYPSPVGYASPSARNLPTQKKIFISLAGDNNKRTRTRPAYIPINCTIQQLTQIISSKLKIDVSNVTSIICKEGNEEIEIDDQDGVRMLLEQSQTPKLEVHTEQNSTDYSKQKPRPQNLPLHSSGHQPTPPHSGSFTHAPSAGGGSSVNMFNFSPLVTPAALSLGMPRSTPTIENLREKIMRHLSSSEHIHTNAIRVITGRFLPQLRPVLFDLSAKGTCFLADIIAGEYPWENVQILLDQLKKTDDNLVFRGKLDERGDTMLHLAITHQHLPLIEYLLNHPDIEYFLKEWDLQHFLPMDLAILTKNKTITTLTYGAYEKYRLVDLVVQNALKHCRDTIDYLCSIKNPIAMNAIKPQGSSPGANTSS
jgi:hypothetical protein